MKGFAESFVGKSLIILVLFSSCATPATRLTADQKLYAMQFEYNRIAAVAASFVEQAPVDSVDGEFIQVLKEIDSTVNSILLSVGTGLTGQESAAQKIAIQIDRLKIELRERGLQS